MTDAIHHLEVVALLIPLIAISLVLIGALLTPGSVGVEERGAILGGIAAVLLAIAWRVRRNGH